jgi:hypothetical protein
MDILGVLDSDLEESGVRDGLRETNRDAETLMDRFDVAEAVSEALARPLSVSAIALAVPPAMERVAAEAVSNGVFDCPDVADDETDASMIVALDRDEGEPFPVAVELPVAASEIEPYCDGDELRDDTVDPEDDLESAGEELALRDDFCVTDERADEEEDGEDNDVRVEEVEALRETDGVRETPEDREAETEPVVDDDSVWIGDSEEIEDVETELLADRVTVIDAVELRLDCGVLESEVTAVNDTEGVEHALRDPASE